MSDFEKEARLYFKHLKGGGTYLRQTGRGELEISFCEAGFDDPETYVVDFTAFNKSQRYNKSKMTYFETLEDALWQAKRIAGSPATALHYLVHKDSTKERVFPDGAHIPRWKKREIEAEKSSDN